MAKLAIKGHETRGKEVIEILEMLGGKNDRNYSGELLNYVYTINEYGIIDWYLRYNSFQYVTFTIEEFLEKFPYKVGDKVSNIIHNENQTITKAAWSFQEDEVIYQTNNNEWVFVNYLQPYKEETMEEKLMPRIDLTIYCKDKYILDLGDYEIKEENGVTYMIHKKPQYPKTYEECCEVLFPSSIELGKVLTSGYNCEKLKKFGELLICRNTYWKIAGEEMGLGKPWEPDWLDTNTQKYCIYYVGNEIKKQPMLEVHHFLAFPSAEMRDAFYEYFKDLIESCQELL